MMGKVKYNIIFQVIRFIYARILINIRNTTDSLILLVDSVLSTNLSRHSSLIIFKTGECSCLFIYLFIDIDG